MQSNDWCSIGFDYRVSVPPYDKLLLQCSRSFERHVNINLEFKRRGRTCFNISSMHVFLNHRVAFGCCPSLCLFQRWQIFGFGFSRQDCSIVQDTTRGGGICTRRGCETTGRAHRRSKFCSVFSWWCCGSYGLRRQDYPSMETRQRLAVRHNAAGIYLTGEKRDFFSGGSGVCLLSWQQSHGLDHARMQLWSRERCGFEKHWQATEGL